MKTNIHEIYTETIKLLSSDVHGRIKYVNDVILWLKLFPLLISVSLLFLQVYLNDTIINYLISFISIFAGLFFALIFIVSDKYNNRRNSKRFSESDKNDEENITYITYIIHSGFISGYQNRYGDNLKPPTNVYHRMTA